MSIYPCFSTGLVAISGDSAVGYLCHSVDNNTFSYEFCQKFALIQTYKCAIPAFPARYACLAINYNWRAYWHAFPCVPRIYRKFLWLWKCWVRNGRRSFFQQLNSFFQEVNLIFQFFNFIQKFFLLHVNLFLFIPAFPALHPVLSRIISYVMYEKPQTLRMRTLLCTRFAIFNTYAGFIVH